MIREAAARELAECLLGVYVKHNLCAPDVFESAVRIIMQAVELDERQQVIERKESVIRAIGGKV